MPLFSFEGKRPKIHPSAFIAPTAVIVGDVTVEENASVWYNAGLRGDFHPIAPAGARIGVRAMVAGGALVTPGTEVPDGTLAIGAPAKVRGPLAGTPAEHWVRVNPAGDQALAQRHKAAIAP